MAAGVRTFEGDYESLARLIKVEWGTHFGPKTHFSYPPEWLAGFFEADPSARELCIEYRDANGELTGFIGAVPRRYRIDGRDEKLALVTLLTSARRNTVGLVGLDLERELFRRVKAAGIYGTYHFCLDGQRTPDLLKLAASTLKTKAVEVESVSLLIGMAKRQPESCANELRVATPDDVPILAELIESAGSALPIHRRVTAGELRVAIESRPPKRTLSLLRDGKPIGLCIYARRRLLGKDETELANIDLLVAPMVTAEEAKRFGRALANDAAENGATFLVAPQRVASVFPYAREAGLRLAMRTLRVFIVPSAPGHTFAQGSAHLLEVE